MSLKDLVQIGTGSWVNPDEVLRIYTCRGYGDEPDRTYVTCRRLSSGVFFDGGAIDTHAICSDWTAQRVQEALGLTDAPEEQR